MYLLPQNCLTAMSYAKKKKKSVCMKMLAAKMFMAKLQGGLYVGRNWNATKNFVLTNRRGTCLAQGHTSQCWALRHRPADSLSRLCQHWWAGSGRVMEWQEAFVEIAGCGKLGEVTAYHLGRMKTNLGRLPDGGSMCRRTGKVEMEREVLG